MSKPADDGIPRRNGLRVVSPARFAALRAGLAPARVRPARKSEDAAQAKQDGKDRKRRKGLKPMSEKRRKKLAESKAAPPAGSKADAWNDGGTIRCPTCDYLDSLDLAEWVAFRRRQGAANPIWFVLEFQHIYRQRWHDEPFNRLRTCGGCHRFVHEKPVIGEAVLMLVKDRFGDLDRDAAFKALGRDPIGCLSNAIERGDFSACPSLRSAALALCARHGGGG